MENEGMSQVTKVLLLFGAVMVVGFVIVGSSRETPEEKMQAASQQASMMSKLALDKCSNAIYAHAKERVYTPAATSSDNMNYANFTWRSSGAVKDAECHYETGNGITLLKVNGETVNIHAIAQTDSSSTSRPASAAGGHGSAAAGGGH
ncbi:hypothetical protein [Methylogaea oryzae]|uniref:Uncharacterized protein n=1 Tax=Methylogaea oryzae TaxID=1295382 RepID=A0A8D4VQR7_9GAMM|nr:hypothetical protein [Methylogaea oryzae]BBL70902.1 hypothetical protein MoryE10_15080 [Methylogaea oryzae]